MFLDYTDGPDGPHEGPSKKQARESESERDNRTRETGAGMRHIENAGRVHQPKNVDHL